MSLERIEELLGTEIAAVGPGQSKKLSRWIQGILRNRGEAYLRDNRAEILVQWEQYVKSEFKTCA